MEWIIARERLGSPLPMGPTCDHHDSFSTQCKPLGAGPRLRARLASCWKN